MAAAGSDRMARDELWGELSSHPDILGKVRMFEQMIPADVRTIVDVGCGDGAITNALGERWSVTGVDSSAAALRHVRTAKAQADARSLPFDAGAFDLAMSSQMLEHLDDAAYRAALAELDRVAARYLLISVPYREDLGVRMIRCPACGHRQHVWGHLRAFTVDSLLRDLEGFDPVDVRIFGELQEPRWPAPMLAMIHHLFRGSYTAPGQHPQCDRCGNQDYAAARGFPPFSAEVKRAVDRLGRRPRVPFWVAVLATRR